MAQIYLVRHGQASFGSQNYDQLSDLGRQQARHLGRWWAQRDLSVSRVVTGTMQRHQQTAQECMAAMTAQSAEQIVMQGWQQDAGFNEYNHHEVLARHYPAFDDPAATKAFLMNTPNGKQQFQQIFTEAIGRWISGQYDSDYSETWQAFQRRCIDALKRQIALQDGAKNIVIFTSGGTISALCQHVIGFPDLRFAEFNWSFVNSGVSRLSVPPQDSGSLNEGRCNFMYLNNFSHLEVLNQSQLITYV